MASGIVVRAFCLGWLLTHAALVAAEFVTYTSQGRPYCNSATSDPDGDGFGWERRATCVVRGGRVDPAKTAAACPGPSTGATAACDGASGSGATRPEWGNFVQILPETQVPYHDSLRFAPGGMAYCTPQAVDPDEDGYGWENNRSCVVRYTAKDPLRGEIRGCTIQVTTHPYCTGQHNNWGFENGRACVGYAYCPANRAADNLSAPRYPDVLRQSRTDGSTRAVYDFLRSIYGHYIISGQMDKVEIDAYDMAQRVFDETGKWPGLMGYDFMNYTRPGQYSSVPGGRNQVGEAIEHWRRGGLVSFLWHWRDPLRRSDHFYSHSTSAKIPINQQGELDRSHPAMAAIDADIATVAKGLKQLRDAGVAVLWRPLHEAAGGWFWWGRARTDGIPAAYAQVVMWRYLYTELTHRYGLNNLIWVWNGQHAGWYPGDKYVDIVGYDSYPQPHGNGSQVNLYNASARMPQSPRMVAMSENGNLPDPEWLDADNANWIWFMTWNDFYPMGYTRKTNFWSGEYYNTREHKRYVYNHPRVLTLEELQHIDFRTPAKD